MTRGALLVVLWVYQQCLSRYTFTCPAPESCSDYAIRVVRAHGARRGLELTITRIENCR